MDFITIESLFSPIDKDPHELLDIFEKELEFFVKKEVNNNGSLSIIAIKRKGLNLFRPYLDQNQIPHSSIKIIDNAKIITIFANGVNSDNEYLLLTDSINNGREIDKILKSLHESDYGIKRICSFIAHQSGLERVISDYPDINFSALHIAKNDDEYMQYQRDMEVVYHNRMEPIDENHPYLLVYISPSIDLISLKIIIENTIFECFGQKIPSRDDRLYIDTKKAFTIDFDDLVDLNRVINAWDKRFDENIKIERMKFRFKFSPQESLLRVTAIPIIHFYPSTSMKEMKDFKDCEFSFKYKKLQILSRFL